MIHMLHLQVDLLRDLMTLRPDRENGAYSPRCFNVVLESDILRPFTAFCVLPWNGDEHVLVL